MQAFAIGHSGSLKPEVVREVVVGLERRLIGAAVAVDVCEIQLGELHGASKSKQVVPDVN